MKILIVHLNRASEVYLLAPVIKKLRQENLGCEIDFLTSPLCEEEQTLFSGVNFIFWDQQKFVQKAIECKVDELVLLIKRQLIPLRQKKYDQVYNLCFSNFSAHICSFITDSSKIIGASLAEDKRMTVKDDMSAYILAQAGRSHGNRVHMVDLFASLMNIDLNSDDDKKTVKANLEDAFHILITWGRSAIVDLVDVNKLSSVIKNIFSNTDERKVNQPGARDVFVELWVDEKFTEEVVTLKALVSDPRLKVKSYPQSFLQRKEAISQCDVVVSSSLKVIDLCSAVEAPCVSLLPEENIIWERGARAQGSQVFKTANFSGVTSIELTQAIEVATDQTGLLAESDAHFQAVGGYPFFISKTERETPWSFIQAIYQNKCWPMDLSDNCVEAIKHLYESNELAIEQLKRAEERGLEPSISLFLESIDETFESIKTLVPEVSPLIRWFQVEKLRLSPGPVEQLIRETAGVHVMLKNGLNHYFHDEEEALEPIAAQQGG